METNLMTEKEKFSTNFDEYCSLTIQNNFTLVRKSISLKLAEFTKVDRWEFENLTSFLIRGWFSTHRLDVKFDDEGITVDLLEANHDDIIQSEWFLYEEFEKEE